MFCMHIVYTVCHYVCIYKRYIYLSSLWSTNECIGRQKVAFVTSERETRSNGKKQLGHINIQKPRKCLQRLNKFKRGPKGKKQSRRIPTLASQNATIMHFELYLGSLRLGR